MTNLDERKTCNESSIHSWLQSPRWLSAVTLLLILASVCFWIRWRGHRQQARLEYFEQIGGDVQLIVSSKNESLRSLVEVGLGEERAAGFMTGSSLSLNGTSI